MKKQVVFIHGGMVFGTYEDYLEYLRSVAFDPKNYKQKRWRDSLSEDLGDDFEVFLPIMPSKYNAKYVEWKIWFEKVIPYLRDGVILIGGSLGGLFLAKYLSENTFPVSISKLFLIAPVLDDQGLVKEKVSDFTFEHEKLSNLEKQVKDISIYYSTDDEVVPISHSKRYKEFLENSQLHEFKDRGHFMIEEFPEIVEDIKSLN